MKLSLFTAASVVLLFGSCALGAGTDVPSVGRNHKFEASFTIPGQTGNPFDPAVNKVDVVFTGPNKSTVSEPAFWDGDRWRVRFAPTRVGAYKLDVLVNGTHHALDYLEPSQFNCTPSTDPGYIRRDTKTKQRFSFDNGVAYYPLGIDLAWLGGAMPTYPAMLQKFNDNHMNWARIWMNAWDGKNLEWAAQPANQTPIGEYDLHAARLWDSIMDAAESNGVYVQMTLQHHGQYTERTDPNWSGNPFNVKNGGFLAKPDDFFADPEAKRLTKNKYRYIVARYGYSTHLMAYELFNEVQNITEARSHFEDVVDWHKEMAAYIRSIDINHHLITTSNSPADDKLAHIGLDYDQVHTYPQDIVSAFAAVKTDDVAVPLFYGEWGASGTTSPEQLHDGLWASMMSPTAGAGQFWYWDSVYNQNLWNTFNSAARFVQVMGLAKYGGMTKLTPAVSTKGPRSTLSFSPPGDWGPTRRFDIIVPPDGRMPDMSGISSYIQGKSNRNLMPQPIVFRLNAEVPCVFSMNSGGASAGGSHPILYLDGQPAAQLECPPSTGKNDISASLSVDVPAGKHTITLDNTGKDWYLAKYFTVTNYAPPVAVLARGNMNTIAFWAYSRDRSQTEPTAATIRLDGVSPGLYNIRLWDPRKQEVFSTTKLRAVSGVLSIPVSVESDVAGVAEKVK